MSFLHVLFAIAFTLALVRARMILALEHGRSSGVLIIDMTVTFLFSGPSIRVVFAARLAALPGSRMGLLVLPTALSVMFAGDHVWTYVKSQGLLNVFSHSLQCCKLFSTGAFFLRRAIDRRIPSSENSSLPRSGEPVGLSDDLTTCPVRRDTVCPSSLIRTSSAGRPLWL